MGGEEEGREGGRKGREGKKEGGKERGGREGETGLYCVLGECHVTMATYHSYQLH